MTPIQLLKAEISIIGIEKFPLNFLEKIIKLEKLEKEIIKKSFVDGVVGAKISHIKLQTSEEYFNEKFNIKQK